VLEYFVWYCRHSSLGMGAKQKMKNIKYYRPVLQNPTPKTVLKKGSRNT